MVYWWLELDLGLGQHYSIECSLLSFAHPTISLEQNSGLDSPSLDSSMLVLSASWWLVTSMGNPKCRHERMKLVRKLEWEI